MDACRAIDGVRSRGLVLEVSGQLSLYRTGQLMPRSCQWAVARWQTARDKIAIQKYLIYYLLWQYWLC